jgi:hypothetical protein
VGTGNIIGKILPYSSTILKGIVRMKIECFGGIYVEEMKKMEKLLRDYGYPEKAIPRLMKEISSMNYEKVKKLILPYNDMTAGRS